MKPNIILLLLLISFTGYSQKGNELLVYSLKGNVSVVENNAESKLKIGKVLKPGAIIKTQRAAQLTMVCKQGKPISVTKEGLFPVDTWKDSCYTGETSITTKYFKFIWDQLYVRSDDYKKDHPGNEASLTDAPVRGNEDLEIIIYEGLDTLIYSGDNFPVSWTTTSPYDGKYFFTLSNLKTKKVLFIDSLTDNFIKLDRIKKWMRVDNNYSWTVSLNRTQKGEGGVIRFVSAGRINAQIEKLRKMVNIPEDEAAINFRIAYLLKQKWYASNAYQYLMKAANASIETDFYREKLLEFRKEFQLKD